MSVIIRRIVAAEATRKSEMREQARVRNTRTISNFSKVPCMITEKMRKRHFPCHLCRQIRIGAGRLAAPRLYGKFSRRR